MHLYFITRGVQHRVDLFKTFMQTQMFPLKRKNLKTGKYETIGVQGGLRPVQLWEYVFPEESLPDVLTMLNMNDIKKDSAIPSAKLALLRSATKSKKIPKTKKTKRNRFIPTECVAIHGIGIKKDRYGEIEGYSQEML